MSSTRLSFLLSTVRSVWSHRRTSTSGTWGESVGGGWATGIVLCFLFLWQLLQRLLPRRQPLSQTPAASSTPSSSPSSSSAQTGVQAIITDTDLGILIKELEGKIGEEEHWEDVIEKKNEFFAYNAKCSRQKDGPIKYLSTTTFEKCSTELVRDFYMDNEYRKKWDKTVVDHEQLEVDEIKALEVGRTIKKFPFLTSREYILIWRLWEGKDGSYYCLIKDCEHPQVPRQRTFVRVRFFKSGWRIKKVPGRDACEIKMVHQEDASLNVEMAKLAFAKGIWNYICKMNVALREYPSWRLRNPSPKSTLRLVSVPHEFESSTEVTPNNLSHRITSNTGMPRTSSRMSTKSWIGKGVLLGGLVCLSRGHVTLATQLAMACLFSKLARQREATVQETLQEAPQAINRVREASHEIQQDRWTPKHSTKFQRSSSFSADRISPRSLRTRQ